VSDHDSTPTVDLSEPLRLLLPDLGSTSAGLSSREVARRLLVYGPNELRRSGRRHWTKELAAQLIHPLALLLWLAAALAWVISAPVLAIAIVSVIWLNAAFAFVQERQTERAVEALRQYLPAKAVVLRDGQRQEVVAAELDPGDVMLLSEGDQVCADVKLISCALEVDHSPKGRETGCEPRSVTVAFGVVDVAWLALGRYPA
jgi:magnesium-transporting ATPase (P-type)